MKSNCLYKDINSNDLTLHRSVIAKWARPLDSHLGYTPVKWDSEGAGKKGLKLLTEVSLIRIFSA